MTALWISLAAAFALFLVWRLRRAAKKVDRIIREERERTAREDAAEHDEPHAEHRNR